MTGLDLSQLTRGELDELIRTAEHAERKAMVAFNVIPLDRCTDPVCACDCHRADHRVITKLEAAAGVAQDCRRWIIDAYDASMLLLAAEFDRVFDLPPSADA